METVWKQNLVNDLFQTGFKEFVLNVMSAQHLAQMNLIKSVSVGTLTISKYLLFVAVAHRMMGSYSNITQAGASQECEVRKCRETVEIKSKPGWFLARA